MANEGTSPIDTGTLAGQVRLLVGDTDAVDVAGGVGEYAWYSDSELEALGTLNGDSAKRTAIWVLSQVAISESLKLKKWTSDDLAVDGPAITSDIEKVIARLSEEVGIETAAEGHDFNIVDSGTESPGPWPEAASRPNWRDYY